MQYIPEPVGNKDISPNTFFNFHNAENPTPDGQYTFLTVYDKYLLDLRFKNGDEISSRIMKSKGTTSTTGRTSTCTDWFLVTTYYYADGTTSTSEVYITTTCSGGCNPGDPLAESLDCPGDIYASGGGGGGGPEYEYEVVKQESWIVAEADMSTWYVKSYERLEGKKVASEPWGGHFTNAQHISSSVFNPMQSGFAAWQQLAATPSYSSSIASVAIAGKVSFPGGGPDIDINRTKQWAFYAVFP